MASTTAKGSGSTVNNGGTIVNAGNKDSNSPVTNSIALNSLNTGSEYGSQVVLNTATGAEFTDPQGVVKAKSAGTGGLAYFPTPSERNFLVRGAGDSAAKVNNDSSTVLTIPGGATNTSIHKLTSTRRLGSYSTASFNVLAMPSSGVVPGRTKGSNAGNLAAYVQADDGTTTTGVDDAASPSRSVPGELTYHFGGLAKPTSTDYKAKNSYES